MARKKTSKTQEYLNPDLRDILLSRKLLDAATYKQCQKTARRQGQSIEEILYKSGLVPHQALQNAVALSKNLQLEFIEPQKPDAQFKVEHNLNPDNGYDLIENYDALNPVKPAEVTFDLAEDEENYGFSENAAPAFSGPKFVTARDFRTLFIQQNETELTHQAIDLLAEKTPELTAKFGMRFVQKLLLTLLILALIYCFFKYAQTTLYYLSIGLSFIFLFSSALKIFTLFLARADRSETQSVKPATASSLNLRQSDLPTYSILVPLYKEANVIKRLTENLLKLDYPRSKLDIKLLFEQDDLETIAVAKQLSLPECFEFIMVAQSEPSTKPKAMNFALPFVRGEFVTIYDAEDRPDPDQLLKAIAKFKQEDDDLACVQASLEYENWDENWMARHFFIEYATQFNRHLPTLEKLKIPLPLGGTSNHFKTKIIREVGGWDAYNVTEDADLGIRLTLFDYRAGTLDSVTLEEANHRLRPWLLQRVRWLKGWMQTIIVHSRHPFKLYAKLGLWRFVGFITLMSGMVFSALIHPFIFILPFTLYYNFDFAIVMSSKLNIAMFGLSFFTLVIGYATALACNVQAIAEFGRWRLVGTLLTAPVYWLLISAAAWLAIIEYIINPFSWSKTEHGMSKQINDAYARQDQENKLANKLK